MEIPEFLSKLIKSRIRDRIPLIDTIEIQPEYYLHNDLALDSLDVMEIIMTAENSLNIRIPDEKVNNINTFQDLCNLIENATEK